MTSGGAFRGRPVTLIDLSWAARDRQVNGEYRALAELAVDVESAAVVAHDMLNDRKAEAGSAELARARRIDAIEALGQPRQKIARDARPVVANGDRDRGVPLPRPARTAAAGPRRSPIFRSRSPLRLIATPIPKPAGQLAEV